MIDVNKDGRLNPKQKLAAQMKLRVITHELRPWSCSSYMVRNAFGCICGGNRREFISYADMRSFDYPTVFRNVLEGQMFINYDILGKVAKEYIEAAYTPVRLSDG